MKYIVSDIHGCYEEYLELLKKINFNSEDTLYVLGDVVDRGPDPIKVLQDMMSRFNVIHIMGNHDFMMYSLIKRFAVEITQGNYDNYLITENLFAYNVWLQDGGYVTVEQFRKMDPVAQADILSYLSESITYQVLEYNNQIYILVHAGLGNFSPEKNLEEYQLNELLEE